ncbi:signal peptidase I [Actinocorallia herbida]|uniref:Signal peptidase I n=1 Tax=Actinocorallia herbida TaxID=58109 RepID=A0A3N1DAA1_9ACTN|nr:signal peptidase I [Actinocorallia herbida]ROO90429.1 signal peptidase I [Actinocorallia herbida]
MTSASTDRSFFKELPFLAVTAVVLALLIRTFVLQTFYIPSGSMERTLHGCEGCTRDRVIVEKVSYLVSDPDQGDIVVFHGTGNWPKEDLIKRVIATAGQTVECCDDGKVSVDGKAIDEPYLYQDDHRAFDKVTVPEGMLWVMGDHRSGSSDSRDHGFVPVDSVVGHARMIIWPVTRWDWL